MWSGDWSDFEMVYMFQRPESMERAARKAQAELRPGALLLSLDFQAVGLTPVAVLKNRIDKPVWIYRMTDELSGQRHGAGNSGPCTQETG